MSERYKVVKEIAGKGGFGLVDKARDSILERDVAIKTLDPIFKLQPSEEDVQRFKREAKTLAQMSHPNVPAVYDVEFDEDKGQFRIIFEWIQGESIRAVLMEQGPADVNEVRSWFRDVTSALSHAHGKGIIHRDVKPQNLIVHQQSDTCTVVDFGIAFSDSEMTRLTQGSPIGTPGYMSPEQSTGGELTPASDVFALGVVLYECLTGQKPGVGSYVSLTEHNEAIPPALDRLVRRSLKSRDERIQSAEQFYLELLAALEPSGSLTDTLANGALYDIERALGTMKRDEFKSIPAGQRRLLFTRLKDLVRVDSPRVRNAVASLLCQFVRLSTSESVKNYEAVVHNALEYGYTKEFSERFQGNRGLRGALNDAVLRMDDAAHQVVSSSVNEFFGQDEFLKGRNSWFYHDLRILLQNLLANGYCDDNRADSIGDMLDDLNEMSHSVCTD